jgi:hypothetical protein
MKLNTRSLPLTVLSYFIVLGAVFATLYAALTVLTPAVYASLQEDGERPVSRLEELTASAREVRNALATPLPAIEPLDPIISRPAHIVTEKAAKAAKPAKAPRVRLSAEARNAFASSETSGVRGGGSVDFDRHRVQ